MLGTALYYPHIDIHQTGWLRSAILFWDEIRTIVPSSIEEPYKLPDTKLCADEGYLRPLHCDLYGELLSDLGSRVIKLVDESEWTPLAMKGIEGPMDMALLHAKKLGRDIGRYLEEATQMHPDKMDPVLREMLFGPLRLQMLSRRKLHPRFKEMIEDMSMNWIHPGKLSGKLLRRFDKYDNSDWLLVDRRFAKIYMSALAAMLAKEIDISPLTNEEQSSGINLLCLGEDIISNSPNAARGALVSVVMEGLRIDPDAPIKKILKFRRKRKDQLAELAGKFDSLKASIEKSEEGSVIETNAKRVFENEIRPALRKLKAELKNNSIESGWSGFQAATTFSTVPSVVAR